MTCEACEKINRISSHQLFSDPPLCLACSKIKRMARGRVIIQQVIREHHGVNSSDFFGDSRLPIVVACRKDAIERLFEAKIFKLEIARLIERHESVVRYHLSNKRAKSRTEYYKKRWAKLRADPVAYEKHLRVRRKYAADVRIARREYQARRYQERKAAASIA